MKSQSLFLRLLTPASLVLLVLAGSAAMAGSEGATGIVASINKAPVILDGNVKNKPLDFVINLDASLDPAVPGRALMAGKTIRITLPDQFDLSDLGGFPLAGAGSSPDCTPGNLICTTGVLLQGWPQNPIPPPNYVLSIDGNSIVYTAQADIVPNPPAAPGIKQMHLILNGVEIPDVATNFRVHV